MQQHKQILFQTRHLFMRIMRYENQFVFFNNELQLEFSMNGLTCTRVINYFNASKCYIRYL